MDLAHEHAPSPESNARLRALGGLAECTGATGVAREAADVAARVAEGRFHVACVGQFKREESHEAATALTPCRP